MHGFASSGASGTVQLLRTYFPDDEIIAPDISMDPAEALPMLTELCRKEVPDLIIGTSMGAMYAQQMHGYTKICVNPAFNMSQLSHVLKPGVHRYLNGRKDSAKEFKITRETLQHYFLMERRQFEGITDFDRQNTYGLFGTEDNILKTRSYDLFRKYYRNAERFSGGHQLNDRALRSAVVPLVKKLKEQISQNLEQTGPMVTQH